MKKKGKKFLITTLSIIFAVVILVSAVGPYFVLMGARQPEVEENYAYSEYFYNSYDEIRAHLKDRVKALQAKNIAVEVNEYAIDKSDNLYIDNIYLPSTNEKENLIVLTTGVHGM